ncbi:alpha/beta hydrolase [Phycicoccus sp. Root101]|uniref:alpha/beta hydrolase n=1 Tax=Phycicoccus sp. Root101 TaxID=1736421 RepID=UPI00070321F1|nr:alpha/beta hydrolase [Phycicoccus sp. Root101]KQU68952.1 esterase [Phycicoccus sp. Root101]
MPSNRVELEEAAQAFADANASPPFTHQLPIDQVREAITAMQSEPIDAPSADTSDLLVPGPNGDVSIRIVRPPGAHGPLPVILHIHGLGWVFGGKPTHDRLMRELAVGAHAAVVFPDYSLSPEAKYPTAIEEIFAVAQWVTKSGAEQNFDISRYAIVGDSVGGNMAAATTLLAKERGGVHFVQQVLFYPVTDATFDTPSSHQFAEGYFLRRDTMQWFWDQYIDDPAQRKEPTASPLQASLEQLAGLPPALIIVGEADVLRDEGEAYAQKLRRAGVPVVAVRYQAAIHDFVGLNPLRSTQAAQGAMTQAVAVLRTALHSE